MFARRADVVEREAARLGALGVAGDLTAEPDLRAPRERHARRLRRSRHPRAERRRPAARPGGNDHRRRRRAPRSSFSSCRHVRLVGLCLPHLRASGRGRIVAIESTSVKEPIANLALSNAVRPGRRRLAEDAGARARPGGDHRQHDRARTDRHRAARRALRPRWASTRDARADPGGQGRLARGDRGDSLLSRVRAGRLHQRRRRPGRRRHARTDCSRGDAQPAHRAPLERRNSWPRLRSRSRGSRRRTTTSTSRTRRTPVGDRVTVAGQQRSGGEEGGAIYYVDVSVRSATWVESLLPFTRPDGASLVPEEQVVPPGSTFEDRSPGGVA